MSWSPPDIYEVHCDCDVTYYPFDTQKCIIEFVPYGYMKNEIAVTAMNDKIDLNHISPNAIWDVVEGDIIINDYGEGQFLNIEIVFKRRTSFYIVNIILPMILMCVLNLIVFLEPFEEGGRVDYATTMLLTIALFMTTISNTLPQSSLPRLPLLCYLIVTHLMISMAILVFTVIGLRIYHKDDEQLVPLWVANLAKCFLCKRHKFKRYENNTRLRNKQKKWIEYAMQSNYQIQKVEVSNDVTKRNESDDFEMEDEEEETVTMNWHDVGVAYDTFCIIFFLLFVSVINILFLSVIFTNYEL